MKMKFDGKEYTMRVAAIEEVDENWCTYKLESGETVKVKLIASTIYLAFDDDGNQGFNSHGRPYVYVSYSTAFDTFKSGTIFLKGLKKG